VVSLPLTPALLIKISLPRAHPPFLPSALPNPSAAMGELAERGLYEIFVSKFGPPNQSRFREAQNNFIVSEAGYAVASYLLQVMGGSGGNWG
jgi:hypothetical protein